jgi:hypothetical protein
MMGLSAGRDSRHILLELHRQQALPDLAWTLDFAGERDAVNIAAGLARRIGIRHSGVPVSVRDYLDRELKKNRDTRFVSTQHGWLVAAINTIAGYDAMYDGIGGDVLSAGLFLTQQNTTLLEQGKTDELVETIVGPHERVPLLRDSSLFPRSDALERVSQEFRRHLVAPDPISSFYFWNRTRRDIAAAPFALLRPVGRQVLTPYLDSDLFALLYSLPPSMTRDKQLHDEAITKAYPDFSDVPYGHKNPVPWNVLRAEALAAIRYILQHHSPLHRFRVTASLVRTMLRSRYAAEAAGTSRLAVYLTQVHNAVPGSSPPRELGDNNDQ